MLQEMSLVISDLVYSLFGPEAQRVYMAYPIIFWGMVAAGLLMPAVITLLLLRRLARFLARGLWRSWSHIGRNTHLLFSRDGRTGLRLARELRQSAGRVRRLVGLPGQDQRESQALLRMLDKFIDKELPEALAQAHTFIQTGGTSAARKQERALAAEEAQWTQSADGPAREALQKQIAATRQRLAQTRHANESREQLLKGLAEAALALRTLEMEMASLGATRSQALHNLRDHLSEMAEGLHHQRRAHIAMQDKG